MRWNLFSQMYEEMQRCKGQLEGVPFGTLVKDHLVTTDGWLRERTNQKLALYFLFISATTDQEPHFVGFTPPSPPLFLSERFCVDFRISVWLLRFGVL